jgi:hypothetical protein
VHDESVGVYSAEKVWPTIRAPRSVSPPLIGSARVRALFPDGFFYRRLDTGLAGKCCAAHGLVGFRGGGGQLRRGPRSLLDASVISTDGAERGAEVPHIDLSNHIPDGPIDVSKGPHLLVLYARESHV